MPVAGQTSLPDRVPPEVWLEIFNEACTDTGLTGRSLSSVSHFFSSVSQPVKYQSIALHGLRQILAFAAIIAKIPVHDCRVKYLFITKEPLLSSRKLDDVSVSTAERGSDAFWEILTAIAPTIEILHVDFVAYDHHPMPFLCFPRLRDLQSDSRLFELDMVDTITDVEHANGSNSARSCALLPLLRYWNITTRASTHFRRNFLSCLPALAPLLSHIRVREYCFTPWGILKNYTRTSPAISALPSSIQKIYVKPAKSVIPALYTDAAPPEYHMQILKDMNMRGDARFVLLYLSSGYLEQSTVGEWLERVDGGDGCWSLREKVLPGEDPWSSEVGVQL